MTLIAFLLTAWGRGLMVIVLLLVIGQLWFFLRSLRYGRRMRVLTGLHLLLGMILFYLTLECSYAVQQYDGEHLPETGYPYVLKILFNLPWVWYALAAAFSAAILIVFLVLQVRRDHRHLSEFSIKEALDELPPGICFGSSIGVPELVNPQMDRYCRQLTGRKMYDTEAFLQSIREQGRRLETVGGIWQEHSGLDRAATMTIEADREMVRAVASSAGRVTRIPGAGVENEPVKDIDAEENWLVECDDGRTLIFQSRLLSIGQHVYRQITAFDMTEQYRITQELTEKHAQLKLYRERLDAYQAQMSELIIARETLEAKTLVHDELGQVLLTCRYYFEHPDRVDQEALYQMVYRTNTTLLREFQEVQPSDPLQAAIRMAAGFGVRVAFAGELSADGISRMGGGEDEDAGRDPLAGATMDEPVGRNLSFRNLLAGAIRECAANAAKHGEADLLSVALEPGDDGSLLCSFTNNGLLPDGPIHEAGGLLSLRRKVEEYGGQMEITCEPEFCLQLHLPVDQKL